MKQILLISSESRDTILRAWGLLVLRVGIGSFMLFGHGWAKLSNFADYATKFADPYGFGATASLVLAIFAEFFCSIAIVFGFLTRLATIPLIITMATAAFIIHGADPFGRQELALMYLVVFLTLLVTGAGRFSLDSLLSRQSDES
ncbi:MAG: DoxX family protein [Candidatus Zixiibacteriota bacterium]|jgi:putative oxidoreductase